MRFSSAAVLGLALVLVACGDDTGGEADAGAPRDAALVEGGVVPRDAAASPDAGAADGGGASTDAGAAACLNGCDPREPSSCGDDAGVCALHDREAECVAMLGELTEGEVCAAEDACAGGLACWGRGTSGEGVCGRICCPSERGVCGDEREVDCGTGAMLVTGVPTSWGRCGPVRTCDVLAPSACGPGEGCYIETEPLRAVCRWAGTRDVGEPCAEARDCLPGFFCGGVPMRACVRVCRVDDPASCPPEEGRCVAQAYSPAGSGVCVASAARM